MLFKSLVLASTASATCLHGIHKRATGDVEISDFGYTALNGPMNWASLGPENEACKTGKNQSPINIDDSIELAAEKPAVTIQEGPVEFLNLGTTIEVVVNGTTSFAGAEFQLAQFHLHTPSEHRIGEEYYPLEMHMVHTGITDPAAITVVGFMFQVSKTASDPIMAGLQPHLAAIAQPGTKTAIEAGLDFSALLSHIQTSDIFQYSGSLTTPPCSEGVTFLIARDPLPIDVDTFNEMKSIMKFNSRFTQNTLGAENLVAVANASGTSSQWNVTTPAHHAAAAAPAAPVAAPPAAEHVSSSSISVTVSAQTPNPHKTKGRGRGRRYA
ncbi:carbonic anhydrase [Corynespora cassiicola Philippines]|uniref:Carbonic anhydrase n=1 Tax=Corynespora cassiicola Philippines TaxID=1448308 RepID=A0A2T2NDN5_CORCC|nr:carbonic anhydrase [Corynespora cassiicola Philippines]